MGDRNTGLLFLPLFALIALAVPGLIGRSGAREPGTSIAQRQDARSAPSSAQSRARTASELLREYYDAQRAGSAPKTPPPATGTATMTLEVAGQRDQVSLDLNVSATKAAAPQAGPPDTDSKPARKASQCLIATLPDPSDTPNLSYMFDRYLDATQRAFEAAGYVLDRYDMPWLDGDGERFLSEPARLLFHSTEARAGERGAPPAALLFVVGETPTAGIHKKAFTKAVEELAEACAEREPPSDVVPAPTDARHVLVLGPSFSGSQASLRAIFQAYASATTATSSPFRFVAVSGSATAVDSGSLTSDGRVATFKSTITRDEAAFKEFLELTCSQEARRVSSFFWRFVPWHTPLRRVALLVEGSSFGRSVLAATRDQGGAATGGTPGSATGAAANTHAHSGSTGSIHTCRDADATTGALRVVELRFPLHVSHLRHLAGSAQTPDPEAVDLMPRRRALTRLDLQGETKQKAVVPLLSSLETASVELVLSALLETEDDQNLAYIGVVATDVQDAIFLSDEVRRHLPNSALFMFSGDLLYLHPDRNLHLRGTQIVTQYPLFPLNQDWTGPASGSRFVFASHTTQGTYNAALALLGEEAGYQEYGDPRGGTGVPLWLSVVGNETIWPVRLLDGPSDADLLPVSAVKPQWRLSTPAHPWLIGLAVVVTFLPLLVVSFSTERGARAAPRFRRSLLAELFDDAVYEEQFHVRRVYLLRCWAGIATLALVLTAVLALPATVQDGARPVLWEQPGRSVLLLLMFAVLVPLGVVAGAAALVVFGPERPESDAESTRHGKSRAAAAGLLGLWPLAPLGLALVLAWEWTTGEADHPEVAVFRYLRALEFDSGVSPLLPLLVLGAAGLLVSVASLRRLRLAEASSQYATARAEPRSADPPNVPGSFLGFEGSSFEGVAALERDVLHAVGKRPAALSPLLVFTILVVMGVAWFSLFVRRGVPTVEGTVYDLFFGVSFLVVNTTIALALLRFVLIWRALLRLLRRLTWHPTIRAYDRMAKAVTSGKPRINLTSQTQLFTALEFSIDRANELVTQACALVRRAEEKPAAPAKRGIWARVLGRDDSRSAGRRSEASEAVPEGFKARVATHIPDLSVHLERAQRAAHLALDAAAKGDWTEKLKQRTIAEQHLSRISSIVTDLLKSGWHLPSDYWITTAADKPDEKDIFTAAEDYLASRVAGFLSHVVPQLQNLAFCVMGGLLLTLVAITSYPFQPRQLLLLFTTVQIVVAVAATLVVFVQMERDTILSGLSETTPGQISWNRDFVSRLLVYVVVPLLGVVTAQFPEVAQQLFSWMGSAFRTN